MAAITGIQGVELPLVGPTSLNAPSVTQSSKDTPENLKKVSREFESFFIYYMLKEMRKTVPEVSMFHGGRAEEIFQGMMDEQLSLELSKAGGIGLAPVLYQQLSRYVPGAGAVSAATINDDEEE